MLYQLRSIKVACPLARNFLAHVTLSNYVHLNIFLVLHSVILRSHDQADVPQMYMVDPSGLSWVSDLSVRVCVFVTSVSVCL